MHTARRGATTQKLCSTTGAAVTKHSSIATAFALTLSLGLGLGACQKSTDLGKMQEETIAGVKLYIGDLETLQRHHNDLRAQAEKLGGAAPQLAEAEQILAHAREELESLHKLAGSAPTLAATAAKSNNPEEILKVRDETLEKLAEGTRTVRDELATFETWLVSAKNSQAAGAVAVKVAPPTQVPPPAPEGAGTAPTPAPHE